jgi:hypothetical protein
MALLGNFSPPTIGSRLLKARPWLPFDHAICPGAAPMRQVALVAIDAIRNIVEILFLIWVQVLAPLKRVDGLKGFAKCHHIVTLRRFKLSSSLNPLEYFRPCQAFEVRELGVDAGLALAPFTS